MYEKNSAYYEDDDAENYHTITGCSNAVGDKSKTKKYFVIAGSTR